jgi:hypothetical protein
MTTGVATALMPRSFSAAVAATLSSITIDADSSKASTADSGRRAPLPLRRQLPGPLVQAHQRQRDRGESAINARRGSTRAAIQPALRTNHSA